MEAWEAVARLLDDPRIRFVGEPAYLDPILGRLLNDSRIGSKLVSDAYLAAFAIAGGLVLTTIDKGFRNFDGLDLQLLS